MTIEFCFITKIKSDGDCEDANRELDNVFYFLKFSCRKSILLFETSYEI
jgi:hypothetical protein